MLDLSCDFCGAALEAPGALLFSPPEAGTCTKLHLCMRCYRAGVPYRGVDWQEREIARLRALVDAAEANAKLHFEAAEEMRAALAAKTLREETVEMLRSAAKEDIASRGPSHLSPRMSAALTDLSRAYPEEE